VTAQTEWHWNNGVLYSGGTYVLHAKDGAMVVNTGERMERDFDCPNARLIAAAPDLLDTLETIAAQSSGVVGSTARADCMAALAKLAIAKAKGAAK
jgi:hypothetical protein